MGVAIYLTPKRHHSKTDRQTRAVVTNMYSMTALFISSLETLAK